MNTKRLARFWIALIIGVLSISQLWAMNTTQPTAAAQSSIHKLNAESADMLAHAVGSEWHDKNKSPLVVDFDKTSPNTPDGINQWLQSQGVKLLPMPKAGISSKKKMLVLRMAFSDRTAQRYTDAEIQSKWFDKINVLFQKMSNGNFPGWDVTINPAVTVAYTRAANSWSTDPQKGVALDAMIAQYIALAPNKLALFTQISQADTVTILLNNGSLTNYVNAFSWGRSFPFPAPLNTTLNKGIILMDEDQYHVADGNDVSWGALEHEMAHAMQQYAGFNVGSNHPSNYNSNYELLDVNMPGQTTDYMKTTGFKDWLPSAQTIAISSNGRTQSDMYCLNAIEIDYHNDPTPQILRINITDDLYYLVSVRKRMNGDELQMAYNRWNNPNAGPGIPDEGVLINRVISSGTQWDDINGNNVNNTNETQDWRVIVRGPPKNYPAPGQNGGVQDKNKLWKVSQEFNNYTDGTDAADRTDGVNIKVVSQPYPNQYCVSVKFGSGAFQPDVALRPWRQAPGNGYETTDIWIDSPLNGYGTFRYGMWNDLSGNQVPVGNGDDPAIGSVNRLYARVRNVGSTPATNVVVNFKQSNPLGVGVPNDSAWTNIGSVTQAQFPNLATIPAGGFVDVYIEWTPTVTLTQDQINAGVFQFHSCVKVNVDQVSNETVLGNNEAQENINNFEATPTRSPLFDYSFNLYNTKTTAQLYHLTRINNLPSGWNLSINNNLESVTLAAGSAASPVAATIPVTVTATGSAIVGSAFTVNIGVSEDRVLQQLNSSLQTVTEHPAQRELGGFDFTVNVLADTSITCQGYFQDGRVSVVGTLDGFQGIHQAGTPLRAYAQLYDSTGNAIALDDRATGDVGANGVFRMNFNLYRSNKGQVLPTPKSVRCLFPGTHLLASSSSQSSNLLQNQAPPTATIVPWFASQFHANLALNMLWAPLLPYGNFTCALGRCPVLVAGKHGRGARMMDASATMLQSTTPVNLGASFSVSTWARRTRNNQAETLVSHGSTFLTGQLFNMGFTDSNQVVCSTFNDELLSTTIISDREWHHYVCVVSGNQRRLYIDGALDGSRTAAGPNYTQNTTMYVGRRMDVARAFDGTIDELGIYSFAINAGQVGQLYALDPNMAVASVGASFDDVVIAENNGVFSYCANQTCPQVYYPDVYYPDRAGNSAPNTCPTIERYQICDYQPKERFAAIYMEPNHPMSYGVWPGSAITPYPGTDSSLMFWARLDDTSSNAYPLVQSMTNPYVNRPAVIWTGSDHSLQYTNLNYSWNDYDNNWHLFTFVKRGNMLELYIDNNRVAEGPAPVGLQPFRVATGSTINVGGVSGGEVAAVELSPLAYPNDYIKWRYENGIPNYATARPTITPQNTLTPTASPTFTASMTPTGTFSSATRTWYKLTVVNPILTAISSNQTAVASATQAAQQGINNALTTTRAVQLQTLVAGENQTATSVQQTQIAINATATSLVATETAQMKATLAGTPIKTATRAVIIVPTFIIIGFPTLFPTYTNTRTVTNSPTANPSYTVTRSQTRSATRSATSTSTYTVTMSRTLSRTATRTRVSTPTFVTMTATMTMSPTAISTAYGPDTVFVTRLPAGMLARALQFIQDQRMNPCSSKDIACPADDWRDPGINDIAIPFYRPDVSGGIMPAYYEISLYDRATKQPRGFIMMAMDYGKSAMCGSATFNDPLCGIVDYPIAHWNSSGNSVSSQLLPAVQTGSINSASSRLLPAVQVPSKLWKLDTLSYIAVQNNSIVASRGAFPVLVNNLSQYFTNYGNTQGDGDTTWSPDNPDVSDDRKSDQTIPDPIHSGIDDDKADQTWKFNDIEIKNNFNQYVGKYPLSFAPLLTQLKQNAKPQWLNERKMLDATISGDQSDSAIPRYNIPVQANSVTSIVLPFRGVTLNNITNETPYDASGAGEPLIKFSLDTNSLSGFSILTITTGSMPVNDLPRLRLFIQMPYDTTSSQGPYQSAAKYTFFLTDKVTQVCPSGDYCPLTTTMKNSRSWAPWRSYWAGTGADQRNYDQFDVGGGCMSGCGPTAWMMLFGWVDYKSSPPPSYAAASVWPKRWNTYHAGGNNTGATTGNTGTAPQGMDDGVRNAVRYIRSVVDTFCFPFSNSGATVPWKMDRAANYLSYVGTGMSLDTHYNIVGVHEDRLTRYALESLSSSNPRPVVIGIGLLAHYPLAWGVQYTTRPENWDEGWFDGDDVVWYQYWYVNEGWGGRNNGWIQTGTWFAGRVNP